MWKVTTFLLTVIMLLSTGCGLFAEPEQTLAQEITLNIIEDGGFPEMIERDVTQLKEYYFGIDTEGLVEASFWFPPEGKHDEFPDEITVVKVETPEQLDALKEFFKQWVQGKIEMWESYNPAQMYKLENLVIETRGDYIALFICDDSAKALEIFNSFM